MLYKISQLSGRPTVYILPTFSKPDTDFTYLTHDHLRDLLALDAGPRQHLLDDPGAQLVTGQARQGAQERAWVEGDKLV